MFMGSSVCVPRCKRGLLPSGKTKRGATTREACVRLGLGRCAATTRNRLCHVSATLGQTRPLEPCRAENYGYCACISGQPCPSACTDSSGLRECIPSASIPTLIEPLRPRSRLLIIPRKSRDPTWDERPSGTSRWVEDDGMMSGPSRESVTLLSERYEPHPAIIAWRYGPICVLHPLPSPTLPF
ncbi:hypothetical protein LX36DRAFT_473205 [Colletotrichum falcatum]|nr:hypothetical protein LX36DRAFT_473205 [Colletotrichum falcatum]